jgi:hypothetical protein
MLRTAEKEHLLKEIKIEIALGFDGFLDMDKSLATVTLEDMEASGGESQEYWLLLCGWHGWQRHWQRG